MRISDWSSDVCSSDLLEIHDPGTAGRRRDYHPQHMLGGLAPGLVERQRLLVQFHAGVAVTLDPAFDQHEQVGPYRLRTGIAAPDAAEQGGGEEQRHGAEDQQPGDVINLLRPYLDIDRK